jgi:hypothetical protein
VTAAPANLTNDHTRPGGDRILPGYIRSVGVNLTALYSYPALPRSTPHQQREARERVAAGETQRSVARSYNVDQATISRLLE